MRKPVASQTWFLKLLPHNLKSQNSRTQWPLHFSNPNSLSSNQNQANNGEGIGLWASHRQQNSNFSRTISEESNGFFILTILQQYLISHTQTLNISMKSSKEGQRAIFSINPIIFIMMQSQIWLYSWFTWWMNVGLWGWPVHLLLWVWKVEEVRWFSFLLGFLIMGSTHLSEVLL